MPATKLPAVTVEELCFAAAVQPDTRILVVHTSVEFKGLGVEDP